MSEQTQSATILHIGIDANEANIDSRVGSNVYAFKLLEALEKLTRDDHTVQFTLFLTESAKPGMPLERQGWKYMLVTPKRFATQWGLSLALFRLRKQIQLFFSPGHYAPRLCPIPYISSVMDLAFLYFPQQFKQSDLWQLRLWTQYSVKNAKRIVSISEFTKQDVSKKYRIAPEKISVLYPAINTQQPRRENQNSRQITFHKYHISEPYILYVGTIQPRKNLIRLVEAFEHLKLKYQSEVAKSQQNQPPKSKRNRKQKMSSTNHPYQDLKLVIAGKEGWLSAPIMQRIKKSVYHQDIIVTGYVTEEEKSILYNHAKCSILIGLHEGFGMPALESLQFKVIPVVSNTTSLPEVVGEAGITVSPYNSVQVMKGIDKALHLTLKQRKEFEQTASRQLAQFSWDESAKKLLELFQNTLQKS